MTRGAIVYVDGLNLYHGLEHSRLMAYRWLDIWQVAEHMLWPSESLMAVRYFNAPAVNPRKRERQTIYNEALRATGVDVYLGQFRPKYWDCSSCAAPNRRNEEKESDVALASHLINDVYSLGPRTVILMSGDGDMGGAISVLKQIPDRPTVRIASPPARRGKDLISAADEHRRVRVEHLVLLPDPVAGPDGPIHKPTAWA